MKDPIEITVPGFEETKLIIRLWTCYPHMLRSGNIVDTDNFIREIDLPFTVNAHDHAGVVAVIREWRNSPAFRAFQPGKNIGTVILAYQTAIITSVTVDTTKFPPHPGTKSSVVLARWDVSLLSKKVFVYSDEQTVTMSAEQLNRDASWVKAQLELPQSYRASDEFVSRHVNSLTGTAFDAFREREKPDPQRSVLKLNQATFVLLGPRVLYRPEPSLSSRRLTTD